MLLVMDRIHQGHMNILKQISYNPLVIRGLRALGLRGVSRNAFYRWSLPRDGTIKLQLGEFDSRFHVRTPEQLRMMGKAATSHWRGDVVYDIGSNIGICSVLAARKTGLTGQVLAFEPVAETYAHLQDNLQLNNLTNARAFRVALADYSC
jgi:hypothetical protein